MKLPITGRKIPHPIEGDAPGSAVLDDGSRFGTSADGKLVMPSAIDPGSNITFSRGEKSLRARVIAIGDVLELQELAPVPAEPTDPEGIADMLDRRATAAEQVLATAEADADAKAKVVAGAQADADAARKQDNDAAAAVDSARRTTDASIEARKAAELITGRAVEVEAQTRRARDGAAIKASDAAVVLATTRAAAASASGAVAVALLARADQLAAAAKDAAADLESSERSYHEAAMLARDARTAEEGAAAVYQRSQAAWGEACEALRRQSRDTNGAWSRGTDAVRAAEAARNAVEVQRKVAGLARRDAIEARAAVAPAVKTETSK
jgi:colicin import membrane protein